MTATATAQIVTVTLTTPGHATIAVTPVPTIIPVITTGPPPMNDGTIVPIGYDDTVVTFALPSGIGNVYHFGASMAVCVYQTNSTPPQLPCTAPATLPPGWVQQTIDPLHFKLTIPKLGIGSQYEYVLFLNTPTAGQLVMVDPPIRCCTAMSRTGHFDWVAHALDLSHDAMAGILFVVALAAGYGLRWMTNR
jgi:hypothetical protein